FWAIGGGLWPECPGDVGEGVAEHPCGLARPGVVGQGVLGGSAAGSVPVDGLPGEGGVEFAFEPGHLVEVGGESGGAARAEGGSVAGGGSASALGGHWVASCSSRGTRSSTGRSSAQVSQRGRRLGPGPRWPSLAPRLPAGAPQRVQRRVTASPRGKARDRLRAARCE